MQHYSAENDSVLNLPTMAATKKIQPGVPTLIDAASLAGERETKAHKQFASEFAIPIERSRSRRS